MLNFLQQVSSSWLQGTVRDLQSFQHSLHLSFPTHKDPPPTTPSTVLYEGGEVRLRYYPPMGKPTSTPLLLVYALIKRPFILDLQPGNSVIENLTSQGIPVYLTDWIP